MELSKTLQNYLDELSSNSPTPGGGNVAALCGVLASSLGTMVCNLTIGKKKYVEVENEMNDAKIKLESLQKDFVTLASKDNEAFDQVMNAFKLPKDTDEQKSFRREAIEKATYQAALVPAEVINKCSTLLPYLDIVANKGNQNSLSDAGVAISLTSTASQGAYLNVLINCTSLSDKQSANELLMKYEKINLEVNAKSKSLLDEIIQRIKS